MNKQSITMAIAGLVFLFLVVLVVPSVWNYIQLDSFQVRPIWEWGKIAQEKTAMLEMQKLPSQVDSQQTSQLSNDLDQKSSMIQTSSIAQPIPGIASSTFAEGDTTNSAQGSGEQMAEHTQETAPPMDVKEKKKLIKLYESLPPQKVAEILEMTKDDILVREVIMSLNSRSSAKILKLMSPERVQKILGLKKEYN